MKKITQITDGEVFRVVILSLVLFCLIYFDNGADYIVSANVIAELLCFLYLYNTIDIKIKYVTLKSLRFIFLSYKDYFLSRTMQEFDESWDIISTISIWPTFILA